MIAMEETQSVEVGEPGEPSCFRETLNPDRGAQRGAAV